ncbi:MAG: A24 family peptidase [Planctomycetota bacterium]
MTIAAGVIDLRTGKVPNRLTYPAVLAGLVFWPAVGLALGGEGEALSLTGAAWLGMLAGLIPFAVLVLTAGLGGGDMKLMAAVGAISASWEVVLSTTVYALIVAVGMAVVVMVRQRIVKQTLGRILAAAFLVGSRTKPRFPEPGGKNSGGVAFAAAVAVGAAVAGAEQLLGWDSPWRGFSP